MSQLQETISLSKHPVTLSQLYFNVLHKQDVTEEMQQFCQSNDIQIIAYRPLEKGLVVGNVTLQEIAQKYKVEPAQIALAWLIAKRTLPIPQAKDRQFIDQNLVATNIKLTPEDITQLDAL